MANFFPNATRRGPKFWLKVVGGVLACLNAAALVLYIAPPGGSREQLAAQALQMRNQIAAVRSQAVRLKAVSEKVQLGSTQSAEFESKYFLLKRSAYEAVIAEIQRMAKASGLLEQDSVFTEEPIEGTDDLTLLNRTSNFEGTYENFMHFLYEADRSPMLLIIENVQAAPQQKGGRINASVRFQAIIREEASAGSGGQP
jgi:hypothetical protein